MKLKNLLVWFGGFFICGSVYAGQIHLVFKPDIIAQTGSPISNALGKFAKLGIPNLSEGRIVFKGDNGYDFSGILTDLGGALQLVAGKNITTVPGSKAMFSSFGESTITANTIAFLGKASRGESYSLYRYQAGKITTIVNAKTVVPGTKAGHFSVLMAPSVMANGSIAFLARDDQSNMGLFVVDQSGAIKKLIGVDTAIPAGSGNFTMIANVSFSRDKGTANDFAFVGFGQKGQKGVYVEKNGKLKKIVDQKNTVPGGVGPFSEFDKVSYDGKTGEVAFVGKGILGQEGVYLFDGKNIVRTVDQESVIPEELDKFKNFFNPTLENQLIIFRATDHSGHEGIYLYTQKGCFRILSTTDRVNKKIINSLRLGKVSLTGNVAAFRLHYADGADAIMVGGLSFRS